LYQGTELSELIGILLITFLGGILYAWVYIEWNNNLWVPIFLHLFMNLSWGLFSVAENALGGTYANIFRLITILLIIGLTIAYKIRAKLDFEINKRTLIRKTPE
jgi:predicted exporter